MEEVNPKIRNVSETETYRALDALEPYSIERNLDFPHKKEKQKDLIVYDLDFIPKKEKQENLKSSTDVSTDENYKEFITELFKANGFIANEHWEKTININSKIIQSNKDAVICECLIDKEKRIFEKRSFPRYLFNHIENFKTDPYVILSIKSKTGSTRIDVIKGAHLVNKKAFELNDEWEKLDGKDFNQPLDKPIKL